MRARHRQVSETSSSDWVRGYAAGIAAMLRVGHDTSAAALAIQGDGVTLAELEVHAEEFDLREIRRAVRR